MSSRKGRLMSDTEVEQLLADSSHDTIHDQELRKIEAALPPRTPPTEAEDETGKPTKGRSGK